MSRPTQVESYFLNAWRDYCAYPCDYTRRDVRLWWLLLCVDRSQKGAA